MKYLRIFLLHFQYVTSQPSKSFVRLLIALFNPLATLVFWVAAISSNKNIGFSLSFITSYYLLNLMLSSLIVSHHERTVGVEDIKEGHLTQYLLKPFSYFWIIFYQELPYRSLQLFYTLLIFIFFFAVFRNFITIVTDPILIISAIVITILAWWIVFLFKMNLGFVAFWTTDISGAFNLSELLFLVFAGNLMPLSFYPKWLADIAYSLPFSYMIYFPIVAFQGRLSTNEIAQVISRQIIWLAMLYIAYKLLWKRGVRRYTAVGQ